MLTSARAVRCFIIEYISSHDALCSPFVPLQKTSGTVHVSVCFHVIITHYVVVNKYFSTRINILWAKGKIKSRALLPFFFLLFADSISDTLLIQIPLTLNCEIIEALPLKRRESGISHIKIM